MAADGMVITDGTPVTAITVDDTTVEPPTGLIDLNHGISDQMVEQSTFCDEDESSLNLSHSVQEEVVFGDEDTMKVEQSFVPSPTSSPHPTAVIPPLTTQEIIEPP